MAHTLIQIQSYLFISQPKVSFQFLIFKESSYMVFTSTYHYFLSSLTFLDCKWDPLPLSQCAVHWFNNIMPCIGKCVNDNMPCTQQYITFHCEEIIIRLLAYLKLSGRLGIFRRLVSISESLSASLCRTMEAI